MSDATIDKQELQTVLNGGEGHGRRKWMLWIALGAVALIVLVMARACSSHEQKPVSYKTTAVTRGDLNVSVSATGNLAATNSVDVGSEESGTIDAIYAEENDHVKKGQLLAKLDTTKLEDSIKQSQATVNSYIAKVAQDEATVKESAATLARYKKVQQLSGGKVPAQTDMDTAEAAFTRATQARNSDQAALDEAKAEMNTAKVNFNKAYIRSPINGVVLTRSAQLGQTVAAGFQVTTLYTIAEDLTQMDLKVYVDEADVGSVHDGLSATFTVDAYPNRTYSANVKRVAYGSTTKDNVVSYSTLLQVKNTDLSLRPGMTATASIATLHHSGALLAPNAALRYTPPVADAKKGFSLFGPPRDQKKQEVDAKEARKKQQQLYVLRNGQPTAVPVIIGATNGQVTEIVSGDLKEGDQVITESATVGK